MSMVQPNRYNVKLVVSRAKRVNLVVSYLTPDIKYPRLGHLRNSMLTGTYQPLFGKDSCILASAGHFVESAGSFQQTACPSGESQPEEGQSSCIVDDDGGLPIIAIAGAAIAVLAIGGILMVQGNSKPALRVREYEGHQRM